MYLFRYLFDYDDDNDDDDDDNDGDNNNNNNINWYSPKHKQSAEIYQSCIILKILGIFEIDLII